MRVRVVVATTKVHIFKQITTARKTMMMQIKLLLLPQRYIFSSKSQHNLMVEHNVKKLLLLPQRYIFSSKSQPITYNFNSTNCCCCYHKGTYFQANHNYIHRPAVSLQVVVATTKVHIFKQITTRLENIYRISLLLLLPQRYIFSSKSQQPRHIRLKKRRCCCYHKGTYFQANHNNFSSKSQIELTTNHITHFHAFNSLYIFMRITRSFD